MCCLEQGSHNLLDRSHLLLGHLLDLVRVGDDVIDLVLGTVRLFAFALLFDALALRLLFGVALRSQRIHLITLKRNEIK